jgi:hypothetical protein
MLDVRINTYIKKRLDPPWDNQPFAFCIPLNPECYDLGSRSALRSSECAFVLSDAEKTI